MNTLVDLADDLAELSWIVRSNLQKMKRLRTAVLANGSADQTEIFDLLVEKLGKINGELESGIVDQAKWQMVDVASLIEQKKWWRAELRSSQSLMAAALVSSDWQSPSYAHSITPQAGKELGKIEGTVSDYKRDHHLDAEVYERAFREAYIDAPKRLKPWPLVTCSGMAAFTTVIVGLKHEAKITGKVLVGKSCYFENKNVLQKFFADDIVVFDETKIDRIVELIEKEQPAAIFLDSLCNTELVTMPDIARLLPIISAAVSRPTVLVLDNTGMSIMCQPLKYLPIWSRNLSLVVIESLNKYLQFGFDRVTGGIMWSVGCRKLGLAGLRMHLGTNMPDASVLALPEPNRELLQKRLDRISRNATYLATTLNEHIKHLRHSPISHVVYPGQGGIMVLAFKPLFRRPTLYKLWISLAMAEAKQAGVDLVAGTSFGFSTTRVYLTALRASGHAVPFLRIAPGMETAAEIEKLAHVFKLAISRLSLEKLTKR